MVDRYEPTLAERVASLEATVKIWGAIAGASLAINCAVLGAVLITAIH